MARDESRLRIAHLLRRAGFGARPEELDAAVAAGYEATVDRLVSGLSAPDPAADAVAPPTFTPPPAPGSLANDRAAHQAAQRANREENQRLVLWWVDRMVAAAHPLREKLTLFWHGHFATSVEKVKEPELMFRQNQLFRSAGGGSFEALTQAVAKDPAMLVWLDSNSNRRASPNENFARELFELFTLGIGNYTEADVKNAARAFTGWSVNRRTSPGTFVMNPVQQDTGTKTVLGETGNLGGEDVVRIAATSPTSARYVASRLWSHFARPARPDDRVVGELATGFARDLDVGRLLRAVLLHPEFLSAATRTGLVKQPLEYVAGTLRALGLRAAGSPQLLHQLTSLGQVPFAPPSVGGWPQNTYWLNTSFGLARLRFAAAAVQRADLASLASASPADRPAAAARLLSVDGWGKATGKALAQAAGDPRALLTLALVAPEHVLA